MTIALKGTTAIKLINVRLEARIIQLSCLNSWNRRRMNAKNRRIGLAYTNVE